MYIWQTSYGDWSIDLKTNSKSPVPYSELANAYFKTRAEAETYRAMLENKYKAAA